MESMQTRGEEITKNKWTEYFKINSYTNKIQFLVLIINNNYKPHV